MHKTFYILNPIFVAGILTLKIINFNFTLIICLLIELYFINRLINYLWRTL